MMDHFCLISVKEIFSIYDYNMWNIKGKNNK